jgi:predicted lipoprotein with Yx(FWY)xxD motif
MKASLLAICLLVPGPAMAQAAMPASSDTAALDTSAHPATISVRTGKAGFYYADAAGMTLYALNAPVARGRSGATLDYCIGPCQKIWTPLTAPADAAPVGLWKVVKAMQGPQWTYRDNLVFTYNADRAPGDLGGDNYDDLWNVIDYVPPAPKIVAPAGVIPLYLTGTYLLGDAGGHVLFTAPGSCGEACMGWTPFAAGMAARDVGDWTVERGGARPQWRYRGKAIFIADDEQPNRALAGAAILQP